METKTTQGMRAKLDPQRWSELKTILDQALQQTSPAARTALVKNSCGGDTALWEEAASLLAEAEALLHDPTDRFEECAEQAAETLWQGAAARIGERLGAYAIVAEIGRGGMGTVYLAARADGQFEKQVAIKVLKRGIDTEEVLRRFRNERQILARLEHPHIARLLDAGTTDDGLPYFVMDYVEGVPITRFATEQELSLASRLELFLKICSAVERAHQAHVIHRDLKPGNILVNAEGEPKLLDFGIAKLEANAGEQQVTVTARQPLTPAAASPEQAESGTVSHLSDVYALGALLYELLSGIAPHQFASPRPSQEELRRVICDLPPVLPSQASGNAKLRGDLDNIVLRAMRKEPTQRYASVSDLAQDIRRHLSGELVQARPTTVFYRAKRFTRRYQLLSVRTLVPAAALLVLGGLAMALLLGPQFRQVPARAATPQGREAPAAAKSIAVLPFQNLSAEAGNAFFAIGVQDAILTDLAKLSDLKVIGRASVDPYSTEKPRNLSEIAQQLGVAYLLEGGVQRVANRVRVTARLIDGRTGSQQWAESYDRDLADVFAIQSEIAHAIALRLEAHLTDGERSALDEKPTRDLAAYDLFLQARQIVDGYLDEHDPAASLNRALRLLDDATRRDSQFVLAYCYAARAHSLLFALMLDDSGERVRQARAALETALRLQPDSAQVHLARAEYFFRCYHDLEAARKELEIAGPRLPNSSNYFTFAGYVDRRQGRWDEAVQHLAKAVELDPRNPNAVTFLADTQILMRRYADAIATYEHARDIGLDGTLLSIRIAIADFSATGDPEKLRCALEAAPPNLDVAGGETPLRILLKLAERDYEGATRVLAASDRAAFQDVDLSFYYPRAWFEAGIARAAGRTEETRGGFASVVSAIEGLSNGDQLRARGLAVLAQAVAGEGESERALALALQAVDLMPVSRDAYDGPLVLQGLAQVYVWTGQPEKAFDVLAELVQMPGYLSYGYLILDPAWEPLRQHPRFPAILRALAPGAPQG